MTKKKVVTISLVIVSVAALFGSGFSLGFKFGERYPQNLVVKGVTNIGSSSEPNADFGTFWQAWSLINDNYLKNSDVSNQNKVYGAIKGLVGSLGDPHSDFFNPSDNKQFQQDIRGDFNGIGAEIGFKKQQLVVISPLKDSPASRAGLRPGDMILKINTTSTDGVSLDQAVSWIRGPKGTEVTLTIYRDGWDKPKDVKITRDVIVVPTLDFEIKENNIAYIHLYSFNGNAERLFYNAVVEAISKQSRGLVLDLRNDPGGYLDVAVNLLGWFVPKGTLVVSEASRAGTRDELRADGNAALEDLPVVVLINGGSASASEIMAGALRDIRHAKLVGETSFGKGTVQQLFPLRDDSSLKITIAHWVLPSGKVLENGGLKPDFEVKLTEEDSKNKKDVQLDKAIEVLKEEINKK